MASPNGTRLQPSSTPSKKRKHDNDDDQPQPEGGGKAPPANNGRHKRQLTGPSTSQIARTLPLEPHSAVLGELRASYDVLTLSVISSSKIEKRVTAALAHLGRFHPSDMAVRPGVVMLHARARDAGKMISIAELVRRRLAEGGYKWYQYNRLYDVETQVRDAGPPPSVVEETVLLKKGPRPSKGGHAEKDEQDEEDEEEEDDDEDDFEAMPTRFKDAVMERKNTVAKPYMSVMLSRVPIPELQAKAIFTCQSNEAQIEYQRRKKMGLA
ncbi:uncharacterized protein E0L32_007112 [Thyridium curvatum]|uniref:DNA/RNA-binding protein Alba-like domain-containing protein n=1 Tax=Thyridium curvatum TaxID=1093900 RepID=A0A507AZJ4_9PEZI|nr:uncharacterized protein E0L32_007112 [Thyridium curvatum]TPX12226.1 hypothetical protein E0L32_007112 [Thyridium curvatum]